VNPSGIKDHDVNHPLTEITIPMSLAMQKNESRVGLLGSMLIQANEMSENSPLNYGASESPSKQNI